MPRRARWGLRSTTVVETRPTAWFQELGNFLATLPPAKPSHAAVMLKYFAGRLQLGTLGTFATHPTHGTASSSIGDTLYPNAFISAEAKSTRKRKDVSLSQTTVSSSSLSQSSSSSRSSSRSLAAFRRNAGAPQWQPQTKRGWVAQSVQPWQPPTNSKTPPPWSPEMPTY